MDASEAEGVTTVEFGYEAAAAEVGEATMVESFRPVVMKLKVLEFAVEPVLNDVSLAVVDAAVAAELLTDVVLRPVGDTEVTEKDEIESVDV